MVLTALVRLMSDYEVTLVNDNSELRDWLIFQPVYHH